MKESNFAKKVLPEYQEKHPDTILMRNNTGMLYSGDMKWIVKNGKKSLIIENPYPVFFGVGLPKKDKKTGRIKQTGGGDRIGWTEKKIASPCCGSCFHFETPGNTNSCYLNTPFEKACNDYIPRIPEKIAIFTSLEIKTKDGKESEDQIKWRETILAAGGIAKILQEE